MIVGQLVATCVYGQKACACARQDYVAYNMLFWKVATWRGNCVVHRCHLSRHAA